jgi:hypothetical protein
VIVLDVHCGASGSPRYTSIVRPAAGVRARTWSCAEVRKQPAGRVSPNRSQVRAVVEALDDTFRNVSPPCVASCAEKSVHESPTE